MTFQKLQEALDLLALAQEQMTEVYQNIMYPGLDRMQENKRQTGQARMLIAEAETLIAECNTSFMIDPVSSRSKQ